MWSLILPYQFHQDFRRKISRLPRTGRSENKSDISRKIIFKIIALARINFNECGDTLKYVRTKTERKAKVNPFVEFEIPDEAKPIIAKYKGEDGKLIISNCTDIDLCHDLGSTIRRFRKDIGLPNLTFYSARKSFAQHAFSLGESESVIDYILGHSLGGVRNKMLFAYIKVTPAMATACVRKVCDFIASSENL